MKKTVLILLTLLIASSSLEAHSRERGPHDAYDWRYGGWISPFFLGGVIGYTLAPRQTVIYETPSPVIIQTPPRTMVIQNPSQVVVQPSTSSDVYEERWIYFDDCKCERKVLVKISQ